MLKIYGLPFLSKSDDFPSIELANKYGMLAFGGDLSIDRLLDAYSRGIFPWYSEGDPITWYSPDPRFVLFPDDIIISRSMKKILRNKEFTITFDTSFSKVMEACSMPRKDSEETWITNDMLAAYTELHKLGYAHSVEAWKDGVLCGGLYGVSLGKCFMGESMFTRVSNASKASLITLTEKLKSRGFIMIDSQVYTDHLESLGAVNIPRKEYIKLLGICLETDTLRGNWGEIL